jgi:hypothetical protein
MNLTVPLDPLISVTCILSGGVVIGEEPHILLRDGNKHEEKNLGIESHGPIHGSQG